MSVAIVKYNGMPDTLRRAVMLCNGFRDLKSSDRVLLKPNVLWGSRYSKKAPKFGFVTTSRITEDLIRLLCEHGCRDISIGEGTIANKEVGSHTFRGYAWTGITKVARKYGVKLIDFNESPFTKIKLDDLKVSVSSPALESDFLINLPVLKTHYQTTVSLGLKNLKGCLDIRSRMEFHKGDLDHLIALLGVVVKPKLTIIDGIYAMEHGPDMLGTAHRMNLIIAGKDILACDMVGSKIMGIEPSSVDHLRAFAAITQRSLDTGTLDLRGENIRNVAKELTSERDFEDIFHQAEIEGVSFQHPGKHVCSGCVIAMDSVLLAFCKDSRGVTLDNVEICCGTEIKPRKGSKTVFLIGDCSIQNNKDIMDAIRIVGCPPKVRNTFIALVSHTLEKRRARKIVISRILKNIANMLGIYNEKFPIYERYKSPEFDEKFF